MDRQDYEKNILDLRYQEQLQKLNAILVFISLGIISFIGTFVWQIELIATGIFISVGIVAIGLFLYRKTKDRMESILSEIEAIQPRPSLKKHALPA